MWAVKGNDIQMTAGDWGVSLPITVYGASMTAADTLKFTVKDGFGGATVLDKSYSAGGSSISLILTKAETTRMKPGRYVYRLDWYHDGSFQCNIIPGGEFRVVEAS